MIITFVSNTSLKKMIVELHTALFCIIVFVYAPISAFVFINTKHIDIFFVVCVGRAVVEEVDCACCL